MNKKLSLFCIASFIVGSIVYTFQYFNYTLPKIINNFLNDFLITPIVLYICLWVLILIRKDKYFTISLVMVLYVCAFYSFIFEYIAPKFLVRYTADIIDIILYFLGGIIFYILQKKNFKITHQQIITKRYYSMTNILVSSILHIELIYTTYCISL